MSSVVIKLGQEDAKLVFLAVAYHLGRPGSELDPVTKQPVEHGLAEVARGLQPQLVREEASVTLQKDQARRLLSGMLGTISELKAYSMLQLRPGPNGGRRSTVPGFDRSLTHLFPEVEEDQAESIGVAERMLMLKRRLDGELASLVSEPDDAGQEQPRKGRGWWPFGRKS